MSMPLRVVCPNGHRLQVDAKHAGKKAACPKCEVPFVLKSADRRQLSDSSIMNVLGAHDPARSAILRVEPRAMPRPTKACPKCQTRFSAAYHVCPKCRVYLGESPATTLMPEGSGPDGLRLDGTATSSAT